MSSSLDQRSSKSHEIHDESASSNSNKEASYEYGPDSQTAYNPGQMGQNSDPYYYWQHYHPNTAGSMQEAGWSERDGMYGGYGQMPNHPDYMHHGMYPGYDYSYWYSNVDPASGSSWNQPGHYYKRNDYSNGSYYEEQQVNETDEVNVSNDYNGDSNGGLQAAEQSFKGMSLSSESEKDHTNRLASSGAPAGKKSWANVVNQQPSRTIPRPRTIPKAPLAPGWEKGGPSKYSQSSGRPMAGEGRQVYAAGGPYSSGGFNKPTSAHYGGDAGGDSGNYKATTNNTISSSSGVSTGNSGPVMCNFNPNDYNPKDFDLNPKAARFFVIKSFSEDDIHRSIKYSIWCSTEYGNKRLDAAYREREGKGQVFLYFSVNGSGHFCGVAQMTSPIDYSSSSEVWAQNKWKGQFSVKWIYVKDVPNSQLRHIKLENNENKPVTNSRDTQEVPYEKGKQVLRIIHQYRHTTSIFDDFYHYEKQQEDAQQQRK